jgi:type IV pilus assembly protein PilY1
MKKGWKHTTTRLAVTLWAAWSLFNPAAVHGSCTTGAAVPPFLAAGLDPNLLLLIDNSASMYDLAYVQAREEGYCYDGTYTDAANNLVESYSAATTYAGYFDAVTWYSYDLASGQFETKTAAEAQTLCNSAGYTHSDAVCVAINEAVSPKTVTAFSAGGNFLNWATSSKLDVQKKTSDRRQV